MTIELAKRADFDRLKDGKLALFPYPIAEVYNAKL